MIDARDPLGTRCRFLEQHLKKNARHKHMILLLNKCDLVSERREGLGMLGWVGQSSSLTYLPWPMRNTLACPYHLMNSDDESISLQS